MPVQKKWLERFLTEQPGKLASLENHTGNNWPRLRFCSSKQCTPCTDKADRNRYNSLQRSVQHEYLVEALSLF